MTPDIPPPPPPIPNVWCMVSYRQQLFSRRSFLRVLLQRRFDEMMHLVCPTKHIKAFIDLIARTEPRDFFNID